MSENAPAPELTPGQKRIAAAHAALAKKRALAALERLRAERIDIENKLAIEPPAPPQEETKVQEEIPIQEEPKETIQQEEEPTQPLNEEKELPKAIVPMSSSEEIVIHELEKPKPDDTVKNKNKKKKNQKKVQEDITSKPILNERNQSQTRGGDTDKPRGGETDERVDNPKRKRTEREEKSSDASEDESRITTRRPRKTQRVDTVRTTSNDDIERDGTMGRIVNAVNGIRNITVPPVVSTVISNSASTIGWAFVIVAMSYAKAYMSSVTQPMERRGPAYNYQPPPQPPQPTQQPSYANHENQKRHNHPPPTDHRPFIPPSSSNNRNYSSNHTPTSYNIFR